jgi:hypothetical protein
MGNQQIQSEIDEYGGDSDDDSDTAESHDKSPEIR